MRELTSKVKKFLRDPPHEIIKNAQIHYENKQRSSFCVTSLQNSHPPHVNHNFMTTSFTIIMHDAIIKLQLRIM
jgi:hypothetical protein